MQMLKPEISYLLAAQPQPELYKSRFPDLTTQTLRAVLQIHQGLTRFAREGLFAEETLGVRIEDLMAQVWRRSCSGERCQEAVIWQVFRSTLGRRLVTRLAHLEIFERVLAETLGEYNAPTRLNDYDFGSRPGQARRQRVMARVAGATELTAERALSLNDYLGTLSEQGKMQLPTGRAFTTEEDAEELCRRAVELAEAQQDRPETCLRLAACLHYGVHDRKFQLILDLFCG
jgi:hypothetical protein